MVGMLGRNVEYQFVQNCYTALIYANADQGEGIHNSGKLIFIFFASIILAPTI